MNFFGLFEVKTTTKGEVAHRENVDKANELYQVQEYSNELWLTFDGRLVCPFEMFKDDAVSAIGTMRGLYLERVEG